MIVFAFLTELLLASTYVNMYGDICCIRHVMMWCYPYSVTANVQTAVAMRTGACSSGVRASSQPVEKRERETIEIISIRTRLAETQEHRRPTIVYSSANVDLHGDPARLCNQTTATILQKKMYGANMKSGAVWATIITLTALLVFTFDTCEAKRGCQAFGHSCYGGHGKRVDSRFGSAPEEVAYGSNQQAGLNDMVFTAPRSLPNTGPLENQEDNQVRQNMPQDLYNLSPFLRQWAYRNSQDFRSNNM